MKTKFAEEKLEEMQDRLDGAEALADEEPVYKEVETSFEFEDEEAIVLNLDNITELVDYALVNYGAVVQHGEAREFYEDFLMDMFLQEPKFKAAE